MFASVGIVRAIVAEVGGVAESEKLGIERHRLMDPHERFSLLELVAVVEKSMALCNDRGLGLSIGASAPQQMLQLLHYLLASCSTLREAWHIFRRYMPLVAEGLTWELVDDKSGVTLLFKMTCESDECARFSAELAFALIARFMSEYGRECAPVAILWRHPEPAYSARYEQLFGCPQQFSQEVNAVILPRGSLDVGSLHSDWRLRNALGLLAEEALRGVERKNRPATRVRLLFEGMSDLSEIDVDWIARQLGLGRGTLGRRLAADGVSIRSLLDDVRCERARKLLAQGVDIAEVSEAVGFSETSAFHRAFKRWTGLTPAVFRDAPLTPPARLARRLRDAGMQSRDRVAPVSRAAMPPRSTNGASGLASVQTPAIGRSGRVI